MKRIANQKQIMNIAIVIIMIAFFVMWFSRLVMTGDDFSWSNPTWWFKNNNFLQYDGRYLANLLNIELAQNFWLRVTLMPLMLTFLFVLMANFVNRKYSFVLLLASFMMFFITPTKILRQVFNWVSGFSVYVYPVIWVLLALIFAKRIIYHRSAKINNWLILVFGFIGQFGSENVTIGNIFLCVFLIIGVKIFNPRKIKKIYFYSAGVVVGAIGQLTNQAYWRIFVENNDTYRSVSGFGKYFNTISKTLVPSATNEQWPLLLLMSLSLLIILVFLWTRFNEWRRGVVLATLLYDGYFAYFIAQHNNSIIKFNQKYAPTLFWLTIGFYLLNLVLIFFITRKNRERYFLIVPLAMSILYLAPFIVAKPFGPRGIFATYVMLTIYGLQLLDHALAVSDFPIRLGLTVAIVVVIVVRGIYFTQITSENKIAETVRNGYLTYQKAEGKKRKAYNYLEIPNWEIMQNRRPAYDDTELKAYLKIRQNTYGRKMKFSKWYPFYKEATSKKQFYQKMEELFENEPIYQHVKNKKE